MKNLLTIAAFSCAALRVASASTVEYDYTGETGGGVVMGIQTANYSGGALVGQFIMTTSQPGFQSSLLTYCTDVGVDLNYNFNYTPTSLSSATGVAPAWISGGIQNAATVFGATKTSATTAIQTAGVQLAIWELLYNTPVSGFTTSAFFNHSNNGFYLTTDDANTIAAANYAATLINGLSSDAAPSGVIWLAPTTSSGAVGGSQGLLYQTPGTTSLQPVPETTSTLALLSLTTAGLLLASRKFAKA